MKCAALACILSFSLAAMAQQPTTWRFDNLSNIGGAAPTIVGAPKLIDTELGKAIHFEGNATAGDALFFDTLPLAGTLPYTWEVVFRPSSAGAKEQRIFHLQEDGTESRRLFETRLIDGKWCLDSFAVNVVPGETANSAVLLHCDAEHLFPLDRWYAVAAIYDGKTLRSYINGVLQGEADVKLFPLTKGGVSVGTRYNKRDFFTGDIFSARFTPRPLPLSELLRVPVSKPPSASPPR
jgi:hypothetical protein